MWTAPPPCLHLAVQDVLLEEPEHGDAHRRVVMEEEKGLRL